MISILVVTEASEAATAGEEATEHLVHGGLVSLVSVILLFPFPSGLLPRVKVHLS